MTSLLFYWHTLRYLKPVQLYGRVWKYLHRPTVSLEPAPALRRMVGTWALPAKRRQSLFHSLRFRFLNQEHSLTEAGWDSSSIEKLWRYNLHYFDDLNAEDAQTRADWHRELVSRWISDNPSAQGTGWEPYPTSLRIINWIKWALSGNPLQEEWLQSLAMQTRWLAQRLEFHLQGNHLFANAKALVFAGLFFDGSEADTWLKRGLDILEEQIPEQILSDGGQFERSTMYHALALEDMLDLYNATNVFQARLFCKCRWLDNLTATIMKMRYWLHALCHPDGGISFFNDAALGIAPDGVELEAYAGRLLLPPVADLAEEITHFSESGYIRIQKHNSVILTDVGPVGPDYLPGHAHADTLSFELSLFGRRVFVNSGTSCYGNSAERLRQRGTAAHNTVEIDGLDSSEVWGGFRVARRAYPGKVSIEKIDEKITVECSHNGYRWLRGRPRHNRKWTISDQFIDVEDTLEGEFKSAVAHLILHPAVKVINKIEAENWTNVTLCLSNDKTVTVGFKGGLLSIKPATWHPEFGSVQATFSFVHTCKTDRLHTRISWGEAI